MFSHEEDTIDRASASRSTNSTSSNRRRLRTSRSTPTQSHVASNSIPFSESNLSNSLSPSSSHGPMDTTNVGDSHPALRTTLTSSLSESTSPNSFSSSSSTTTITTTTRDVSNSHSRLGRGTSTNRTGVSSSSSSSSTTNVSRQPSSLNAQISDIETLMGNLYRLEDMKMPSPFFKFRSAYNFIDLSCEVIESTWEVKNIARLSSSEKKARSIQLKNFIANVIDRAEVSSLAVLVAITWIEKLKVRHPKAEGGDRCGHRLFLVAVLVACKVCENRRYDSRIWSSVSDMFTKEEVDRMTVEFLNFVKQDLKVEHATLNDFLIRRLSQEQNVPPSVVCAEDDNMWCRRNSTSGYTEICSFGDCENDNEFLYKRGNRSSGVKRRYSESDLGGRSKCSHSRSKFCDGNCPHRRSALQRKPSLGASSSFDTTIVDIDEPSEISSVVCDGHFPVDTYQRRLSDSSSGESRSNSRSGMALERIEKSLNGTSDRSLLDEDRLVPVLPDDTDDRV
eukprot:Nk52_evm54s2152 gene=Nk52_evmTU54s2152